MPNGRRTPFVLDPTEPVGSEALGGIQEITRQPTVEEKTRFQTKPGAFVEPPIPVRKMTKRKQQVPPQKTLVKTLKKDIKRDVKEIAPVDTGIGKEIKGNELDRFINFMQTKSPTESPEAYLSNLGPNRFLNLQAQTRGFKDFDTLLKGQVREEMKTLTPQERAMAERMSTRGFVQERLKGPFQRALELKGRAGQAIGQRLREQQALAQQQAAQQFQLDTAKTFSDIGLKEAQANKHAAEALKFQQEALRIQRLPITERIKAENQRRLDMQKSFQSLVSDLLKNTDLFHIVKSHLESKTTSISQ